MTAPYRTGGVIDLRGQGERSGQLLAQLGQGLARLLNPQFEMQNAIRQLAVTDPTKYDQIIARFRQQPDQLAQIVGPKFAGELLTGAPLTEIERDEQALRALVTGKVPRVDISPATGMPTGVRTEEFKPDADTYIRAARAADTTPVGVLAAQILSDESLDLTPQQRYELLTRGVISTPEGEGDIVSARRVRNIVESVPDFAGRYSDKEYLGFVSSPQDFPEIGRDYQAAVRKAIEAEQEPEEDIVAIRRIAAEYDVPLTLATEWENAGRPFKDDEGWQPKFQRFQAVEDERKAAIQSSRVRSAIDDVRTGISALRATFNSDMRLDDKLTAMQTSAAATNEALRIIGEAQGIRGLQIEVKKDKKGLFGMDWFSKDQVAWRLTDASGNVYDPDIAMAGRLAVVEAGEGGEEQISSDASSTLNNLMDVPEESQEEAISFLRTQRPGQYAELVSAGYIRGNTLTGKRP